jgi:hypothetical protein
MKVMQLFFQKSDIFIGEKEDVHFLQQSQINLMHKQECFPTIIQGILT